MSAFPAREKLVTALEALIAFLEANPGSAQGTYFPSAQQPLAELSVCIWQFRRGNYAKLLFSWLLVAPHGPIAQMAQQADWSASYDRTVATFKEAFLTLYRIRYSGSEEPVALGDDVRIKGLWGTKAGRVTYLPGQPRHSPELDFGGICRVGVSSNGRFTAVHVDPHSLELKGSVTLQARNAQGVPAPPSEQELAE